jgi:hypothetical protein
LVEDFRGVADIAHAPGHVIIPEHVDGIEIPEVCGSLNVPKCSCSIKWPPFAVSQHFVRKIQGLHIASLRRLYKKRPPFGFALSDSFSE